ncbi:hypothetical protein NW767_014273 [Fusarium falciforme]|nr:hypothetical protein NW767_014273 [Fusarium falciforme]
MKTGSLFSFAVMLLAGLTATAEASSCRARPHGHSHGHKKHKGSAVDAVQPSLTTIPTSSAARPFHAQPTTIVAVPSAHASAVVNKPATAKPSAAPAKKLSAQPAEDTTPASEIFWGTGTRYGSPCTEMDCWQNAACSFVGYDLPAGIDGSTCVSNDIWDNGGNCGGCIAVTYKGKTLKIMVTNRTGGNGTHLDMTPDTYSKLTNGVTAGGVKGIKWEWISCPFGDTVPLQIHMHGGSSRWWFSATVENGRLRTKAVEVSADQGKTRKPTTRKSVNMYVLKGSLPSDTVWVRATSIEGHQVVVKDVALKSGQITKATENY